MRWPASHVEMISAGYVFLEISECLGCRAKIEFWKTPKGKRAPFDRDENKNLTSHLWGKATREKRPQVNRLEARRPVDGG